MFIEKITVRTHLNDIYSKLDIHSLAGLIAYLYKKKLNQLQEENEKLAKCLNEIEEMCKHDCEHECSNNSNECEICSCLEQRVQRKIKEVGGE